MNIEKYAAAIGENGCENAHNIIINSGNIITRGGEKAVGIGAGYGRESGIVTINGENVDATLGKEMIISSESEALSAFSRSPILANDSKKEYVYLPLIEDGTKINLGFDDASVDIATKSSKCDYKYVVNEVANLPDKFDISNSSLIVYDGFVDYNGKIYSYSKNDKINILYKDATTPFLL